MLYQLLEIIAANLKKSWIVTFVNVKSRRCVKSNYSIRKTKNKITCRSNTLWDLSKASSRLRSPKVCWLTTPSGLSKRCVHAFYCKKTQGTQDILKARTGEAGNGSVSRAPSDVVREDGDREEERFRSDLTTTLRFVNKK